MMGCAGLAGARAIEGKSMASLEASPERRKWGLVIGLIALVLIIAALSFYLPRLTAAYELYWGQENIRRLFYEDLGLSEAWSSFIAVVASFFYALAWVPLSLWTYRVLVWRFNTKQFITAFVCWVLVYGHVPLLHATLGSDACFNQRTGAPQKWYVEGQDGQITLFDSGGYDVISGSQKHPVTPSICKAVARQKTNTGPRKVTGNLRELQFFDPISGHPRVWYHRASDGSYDLFDGPGYDPNTSEALNPVTKDAVAEIMKQAPKNCFMFNGERVCE